MTAANPTPARGSTARLALTSAVAAGVEWYDFFVYGTAAALVFPHIFFSPELSPLVAQLAAFSTFAVGFIARPLGGVVFGHFGDLYGRKATLVAALMIMGVSTVVVGLLPTYASIGMWAPLMLIALRFAQGFAVGGQWGAAALIAIENAPEGRRGLFGSFVQIGVPAGVILANVAFIVSFRLMDQAAFEAWGWRIPFMASALLVFVGLWVRLKITETPAFQTAIDRQERVKAPALSLLARHKTSLILGTLAATATFVLFYLMTVFTLGWATTALGYTRGEFLPIQLFGVLFFGLMIPISALVADRVGRRPTLMWTSLAIAVFGLVLAPLFGSGDLTSVLIFFMLGFSLMGFTYGPLGAALSDPFPTAVRYTGASMTFNLAGIVGASLAPYIATWLAGTWGLAYVGYYLAGAGVISALAFWGMNRLRDA